MGDTRKLIRWGSSKTLIVSMPRNWVKKNGLSEDQTVKIQDNPDGTLTIIPEDIILNNSEISTIIKVKDVDDVDNIQFRILTSYLDGSDTINVEVSGKSEFSPVNLEKIEKLIEPLMGLQIMGSNPKKIVIKNILQMEGSDIFSLIKLISDQTIRLGNILIGKIKRLSEFSEKTGRTEWRNIKRYHYQITREQRKALLKPISLAKMDLSLQDILDFQFYISSLYNIAEIIKYTIDTEKKFEIQKDEFGITSFVKIVMGFVKDSIDSFLFKETNKAINIMKKIREQKPLKRKIENKVDDEKTHYIMFQIILDMTEKILDYCEDVCLAALRRAI
ncbi:MAG: AbrB/MazE/SpoVT family DNA-binding domain-containing protein [Promethearchaeota archaeon]